MRAQCQSCLRSMQSRAADAGLSERAASRSCSQHPPGTARSRSQIATASSRTSRWRVAPIAGRPRCASAMSSPLVFMIYCTRAVALLARSCHAPAIGSAHRLRTTAPEPRAAPAVATGTYSPPPHPLKSEEPPNDAPDGAHVQHEAVARHDERRCAFRDLDLTPEPNPRSVASRDSSVRGAPA
jgi:hypothetical protein